MNNKLLVYYAKKVQTLGLQPVPIAAGTEKKPPSWFSLTDHHMLKYLTKIRRKLFLGQMQCPCTVIQLIPNLRLYQYWNVKYAEIESVLEDKKTYPHVWVFYCGDCDPSGRKMDLHLAKELMDNFRKRFERTVMTDERIPPHRRRAEVSRRMTTIYFKRIAVTIKQIPEFNLEGLTDPESKTLLKLEGGWDESKGRNKKGDPNTEWFKRMFRWYGKGTVFQIELDAMYARREQFKQLLLETIDGKFDNEIYQKYVVEKLEPERDALTMRLKDKLINEKIELPGWKAIEHRINILKVILSTMAERAFFMDMMFAPIHSVLEKKQQKLEGNSKDDSEDS